MWQQCPDLLLADELDVLKPGALLVLGADPEWVVTAMPAYTPDAGTDRSLAVGTLTGSDWRADVYALPHPRVGAADEAELLRQLGA